ncbi:MAG TPA: DUF5667 domain-containing protein [Pseudonocardia sp.]|jgi:hypothetical protein
MPARSSQESERFAAAVERGTAVAPGDEQLRQDMDLVALLRESRASLAPDADASARMRAKVMAAAASMMSEQQPEQRVDADAPTRIVADAPTVVGTPAAIPVATANETTAEQEPVEQAEETNVVSIGRARGRHRFPSSPREASPQRRGLVGVSAAAALMVLAVTGGGAMFSQGALPGDSLYGVKQTTESALVGLTPGQGNKAQRQLDYAATRLDEVKQLNSQTESSSKGADISQALRGFDDQAAAGSRMWLASSGPGNAAELGTLANWAQTQSARLSELRSSMPTSAQPDADHSLRMLEDVRTRAQSLNNRQGCDQVTSNDSDELGPLPAKGSCGSKESVKAPNPSLNTPSAPSVTDKQSGGSSSSSSEKSSRNDSGKSDNDSRSGRTGSTTTKETTPHLPSLPGITGGSDPVPGLNGRQQTKGNDPLPSTTEKKAPSPGLNLPLLGPIAYQPGTNGPAPANG